MALHWIAVEPGDLGVFSLEEYDVPPPGPGEVTIEVRAAGMNPADYSTSPQVIRRPSRRRSATRWQA
jgi:NADPH:quinone reductase-like Zn-dependent oxidoreductase